MKKLSIVFALVTLLPTSIGGQSAGASVETLYADARAKEKAVRTALADPSASSSMLRAVRTVVGDYEAIVRRFPASAYSDDALWFAGWLAIDAFERFRDEQERTSGVRLWRALAAQYPSSKLAKQVPQQLAKIDTAPGSGGTPSGSNVAAPGASVPSPVSSVQSPGASVPSPGASAPAVSDSNVTPPRAGAPAPGASTVAPASAQAPAAPTRPPAAPSSSTRSGLATLKDIRRTVLADTVRVTLELDREIVFRDERLTDPARMFVDLPTTRAAADFIDRTIRFERDADLVRQIRVGRHPNDTTRVVLDMAGISSYSIYPLYSPYRLVIDCVRETPGRRPVAPDSKVAAASSPPATLSPAPSRPPLLRGRLIGAFFSRSLPAPPAGIAPPDVAVLPTLASRSVTPAVAAVVTAPADGPAPANGALTPPARNVGGGFSIARQLGLSVSRIVIDPGHGGHDPGATGTGVTEAAVVLDVALRLEKLLVNVPGVKVILTRRADDYVSLQERTAIANREGADLFLSIHANASSNLRVQGVETYFLNFATTSTAAAVAARENASSGQPMGALPDFVKAIALHNKLDESRDLATHVQRAMVERLSGVNDGMKDLGVKQAPFVVLIGASMPSVLTEISFVTNAQEVKLLRVLTYRQRIADALFNAIRKYQSSLKTEAKTASN